MTPRRKQNTNTSNGAGEAELRIVIALDFGTTFSGLAWAQTREPENLNTITAWPRGGSQSDEGKTEEKCPTEIAYEGPDFKWGFQIDEYTPRHQWFKLDLDPSLLKSTGLSQKYPDRLAAPPDYNSDAEKLTTDYMTALKEHAEQVLRYRLPTSALRFTPIDYIITVPAVWSDKAQASTLACARKAGLAQHALYIISEPEAAAVFALHSIKALNIKAGDTFVLCDAGGGTVDCITYTVASLTPVLELIEATPGTGALCGSSILNRRFQIFLEEKLGKDPMWEEDVLLQATEYFENVVKKSFRGTFEEKFNVPVPCIKDSVELGVKRAKFSLHGTDVREIFEPVLDQTVKLVIDQIRRSQKNVKAVILVGGFGQNTYLREKIAKELKHSSVKAEVIQPTNGWTAVVKGALMRGLSSKLPLCTKVKVSGRSARKHYGLYCKEDFDKLEHPFHRRHWDGFSGKHQITLMHWFISKGSLLKEEEPVRLGCFGHRAVTAGPFATISVSIYVASDSDNTGAPKFPGDEGMQKLVTVDADLSRIPCSLFPREVGADGLTYYKIDYEIQMICHSADTSFELIHNNVNYGLVKAEYV